MSADVIVRFLRCAEKREDNDDGLLLQNGSTKVQNCPTGGTTATAPRVIFQSFTLHCPLFPISVTMHTAMRKEKRNSAQLTSITEGSIPKALISFFFPIFFGSLFQQLYNTVDAITMGRFVGTNALAAVGGAAVYVNLLIGLFVGISNGAAVVISQYYGAQEKEKTHDAIETSMALAGIGGLLVMGLGLFSADWGLRILGTPLEIREMSKTYLVIYFSGMVPMFLYNMGASVLRSMGDSRTPLYILIISCFINIFADLFFVIILKIGVAGVAWATVLSQVFSTIAVVIRMRKNSDPAYQFHLKDLCMRKDIVKKMLAIGIPSGIQGCMFNISNLLIQGAINSLGTTVIAANAAYEKLEGIFWMCINSFGTAMTVFSGQNYGANKMERLRKGNWVCLGLCACMTMACTFCFVHWGRAILMLFTSDEAVLEQGMIIIHIIPPTFLTYISVEVFSGTIRGCGQSVVPTLFAAIGICLSRVLWILFVFPLSPSIRSVMYAYPVSWSLASVMFWIYYFKGHWMRRDTI